LYHVAPTDDCDERDEHRESQSQVKALYPKPFAVLGDRLNEIAGGAPAEHLVLCGHIPRISGRSDCNADLFERAGNRIFEVTENFCTQGRGIGSSARMKNKPRPTITTRVPKPAKAIHLSICVEPLSKRSGRERAMP
jgi:hypothetical protein